MKRHIMVILVLILTFALTGCGDDETNGGIVVEDASGNAIASNGGINIEIGPDGQTDSQNDEVLYQSPDSEELPLGEEEQSGPVSPDEDPELMEEEVSPETGGFSEEGVPVTDDDSPIGNGPEGNSEEVSDAGNPYDAVEDGAGPGGVEFNEVVEALPPTDDYETAPSFSSSSVSADLVVSKVNKYISLGTVEETPDGSKNWSASNDTYNVEINADASGKVYSAYFSATGDGRSFLEDCASVFDAGAQNFINSNSSGIYESNGLIFELEISGREMSTLRIMSKSYETILGSPE